MILVHVILDLYSYFNIIYRVSQKKGDLGLRLVLKFRSLTPIKIKFYMLGHHANLY